MKRYLTLVLILVGLVTAFLQLSSTPTYSALGERIYLPLVYKQLDLPLAPTPTRTPTSTPISTPTTVAAPTATNVPSTGRVTIKSPIISRDRPTFSNVGGGNATVDGNYGDYPAWRPGLPSTSNPAWLAIQVGGGYSRLLLNWTSTGNYDYTETKFGAIGDYLIQTSSDSTNGADGNWTTVSTVFDNRVRQRAHSFDFTGKSWVRIYVTAAVGVDSFGIVVDEIDIHNISAGADDVWVFFGDSIPTAAFDRRSQHQPSFAAGIEAARSGYFPVMINAGIGSQDSRLGADRIDSLLQLNPDAKFIAIHYGTNDAWDNPNTSGFRSSMQTIINKVKAAGKTPVISRILYVADGHHNYIPDFNLVVDDLVRQNGLVPGPDFYAWFQAHPDELGPDQIHPNDKGCASMNRLWTEAMLPLYQ